MDRIGYPRLPGLAVTGPELSALRRHLRGQISTEHEAFEQDRRNERRKIKEHEEVLAQRRQESERSRADELVERRKPFRTADWKNRDFKAEAARKVRDQNGRKLNRQFGPEAFLERLVPHLFGFASNVATFERTVLAGLPPSERHAHARRVVARILEMIFPRTPVQDPPPPKAKRVRVSEEKKWAGEVIAGPFEILEDSRGRLLGWRPALYAERRGEFERLPIGDLWGLLRLYKKKHRLLRQMLKARLISELLQMAEDRRSRRQMVEDCQEKHGVVHKNIAEAARVSEGDFYKWRDDNPQIGAEKSRRILRVVCSPVWPPFKL